MLVFIFIQSLSWSVDNSIFSLSMTRYVPYFLSSPKPCSSLLSYACHIQAQSHHKSSFATTLLASHASFPRR